MALSYDIIREKNSIIFNNTFSLLQLPSALKLIYDAIFEKSYKNITLDFSNLDAAFADGMVPLCSRIMYLKNNGIDVDYIAPNVNKLSKMFINTNWAHLIDNNITESKYSGYLQFPTTIVNNDNDLSSVVNNILDCVLRATELRNRRDLGVIEWSINEIAENILRHSESSVGGLVHMSRFVKNKKCIEIVFADSGIGIANSLKIISKYSNKSDAELIELATQEGITNGKGMGNGLFGARSACIQSNGYFKIYSNHGKLEITSPEEDCVHLTNMKIPFNGTAVCVALNFSTPGILERALKFNNKVYHCFSAYTESKYDDENLVFMVKDEVYSLSTRAIGLCFRKKIVNLIEMQNPNYITFDFIDIDSTMSSSFADEVFGKLIEEKGRAFLKKIILINIADINKNLISRAIIQRLELNNFQFNSVEYCGN